MKLTTINSETAFNKSNKKLNDILHPISENRFHLEENVSKL